MFISFVLIQVKRTKEKVKTSTGQFHFTLCILITVGTGVYLLSDSPKANDIMELRSIGQV
ncbi:MAG: hypothetical protein J7K51_08750 [Thermotogae bacterium]|nr:hypothetical protein [Thermotogota bacterium]MCD6239384.1 hypothetical protein [Thermotogota bacterium]